jgi:uncharacterized protein with PQ loop repeat
VLGQIMGWLGATIFVARQVPQALRLLRTRESAGVSKLGAVNAISNTSGWVIYGLGVDELVLWVPCLFAIPFEIVVLALIKERMSGRERLIAIAWAAAIGLAWPIAGQAALATVMGLGIVAGTAPHVLAAFRSSSLAGVEPRTWRIAIADGLLWGGYGVSVADPLVIFYCVVLVGAAVLILGRHRRWRAGTVPVVA